MSWNDSEVTPDLVVSVERNTKQSDGHSAGDCNLFVTAVSAQASKILVKGAKSHIHLGSGLKWEAYKHKFQCSEECKSVIKGLDTRGVSNITGYVKNIVNQWRSSYVNASYILSVEKSKHQIRSSVDHKCNLFVTATSTETCRALIRTAKQHLRAEDQIKWIPYEPLSKSRSHTRYESNGTEYCDDSDSDCQSLISTTSSVKSRSSVKSTPQHKPSNSSRQKSRPQTPLSMHGFGHNLNPLQTNFLYQPIPYPFPLYPLYANNPFNPYNPFNHMTDPSLSSRADKTKKSNKHVNNTRDRKDVSNMLIITGIDMTLAEDMTKYVRKMIMGWNDRSVNGNFISRVYRDMVGGSPVLVVDTNDDKCSKRLVSAAQKQATKGSKVVWSHYPIDHQ